MSFKPRYTKIVQSGDLLEIYEYEKEPLPIKRSVKRRKRYKKYKSERHIKRSVFNFKRKARATLIVGAPHMLTLTMGEIVDISTAYKLFTAFGVRMRKVFGKSLIWITVPEFQKRGAVHFHSLVWNLPHETHITEHDTRRIQNLWGYGFVDIIATDGSPKLSSYLAKYMSKAMYDDRLLGKKAYSCSRNVMSPVSFATKTSVAFLKNQFGIDTRKSTAIPDNEREYTTKWLGKARYRAYESTIKKETT